MLTNTELAAIRERAEKATQGPWRWIANRAGTYLASRPARGWFVVLDCVRHGMQSATVRFRDQATDILHKDFTDSPDATFIAHARADVPALLAHIEELEEKLQRALDYAKRAEASFDYERSPCWRWTDMVELLEGDAHSEAPEVRE